MGIYKELTEGGLFTMPFLLHIYDESANIYLINDNVNLLHDGHTYRAGSFYYNPAANGDATLEASIFDNVNLLNIIERTRRFNCELIGVYKGGEIVQLAAYKHQYGDATWDGERFQIKLNADDRGSMTFPALIFNSYNNRGGN